jgi:hypothetical protein
MTQPEENKQHKYNWKFLLSFIAIIISITILGFYIQNRIDQKNYEKRKEEIEKHDAALSKQIHAYADPIIEAIYKFKSDNGYYPEDLQALTPRYLIEEPYAAFGNKLVYFPEDWNGAPFTFLFRGNYSGLAFMHGWAYIYCPLKSCDGNGVGVRRLDSDWIFIHISWN